MINLKEITPTFITITPDTSHQEFMKCLTSVGHTGWFSNFNELSISSYLHLNGFKNISSSNKRMYFTKVDEQLLVIQVETALPFEIQVIKSKYWLKDTPEIIQYLENRAIHDDNPDSLFSHLCNDHKYELKLYDISFDSPAYEYFVIMDRNGINLTRVDIHLNYQEGKLMLASIFHKKGSFIQIQYDDNTREADDLISDFIEFAGNKFVVARMLNRNKNFTFDLMRDSEIIDTNTITLDNFHLFWKRFTPEQTLLLEMSAV